jgi:hypothetical protein
MENHVLTRDSVQYTPLGLCSYKITESDAAKILLKAGADPTATIDGHYPPVLRATQNAVSFRETVET